MSNNQDWQWREWNGLPYLTCNLFQHWQHGFFTQQFQGRSPKDLTPILNPSSQTYQVKQVHGNKVLKPSEMTMNFEREGKTKCMEADAIITESPQQSVWVASADCTPVLIADQTTGRVAAIHAGWRGTAKRIVPEAIALLVEMGSNPQDLIFALGPAINGEVYQVGVEVAMEVGKSLTSLSGSENVQQLLEHLKQVPSRPILDDPTRGKVKLDVRMMILLQLEELQIKPRQIAIAPYCTYQKPEYFFSYRRTGEKKVQWSGIISK